MKKLVVFLVAIWLLIGAISLFVWWTVGRRLTADNVTNHANRIAKELEIPWTLRFKKVKPAYGADFKVLVEDIEAITADGLKIIVAKKAEVRLPWMIFFSHDPVRVNIAASDVSVKDWVKVLREVEVFLEKRKSDSAQEISLPRHIIDSTFNLRLNKVAGPWNGKDVSFEKLYLLNVDPKKPTAFEAVFPWETIVNGAIVTGEIKALGEYRFSKQKVDLHYYLKTRLLTHRNGRSRGGDFSIEGKGFFHPRLGLFSTLASKDDWIAFVGDLEWTPELFKLNVPKFTVSHNLLLDLLPFSALHHGEGNYQTSSLQGELKYHRAANEQDFQWGIRTRSKSKHSRINIGGGEQTIEFFAEVRKDKKSSAQIKIGGTPWFDYNTEKGIGKVSWSSVLFLPSDLPASWYSPQSDVWRLFKHLPTSHFEVSVDEQAPYTLDKTTSDFKIQDIKLSAELPRMGLIYSLDKDSLTEWSARFDSIPLDNLFKTVGEEFFLIPGHAYSGYLQKKEAGVLNAKLAWKGSALAILAKSSCKALVADKSELSSLLKDNFTHQVEMSLTPPNYQLVKWNSKSSGEEWNVTGSWSNSPIRCQLNFQKKVAKRKTQIFEISLN